MAAVQLTETLSIEVAVERIKLFVNAARGIKPGKMPIVCKNKSNFIET
jgi:hypothetical protein